MKKNLGMMKRILALILALVMTLSCAPVQAFATETVPPTEAVETVPTEAETTVPETLAPEETVPATEESTPETTEETEPTASETEETTVPETTEETVPETTEETVPEITVSAEETMPMLLAEEPDLSAYQGKVISILGDSISTFAGYIPKADGFNLEHLARYPQDNLLTDVNETWWMQVIQELDAKLGVNDSWRGSTVSGYPAVTTGVAGYLAAMSNPTQIQNLGSNGTPDVILFYGGTNDLAHTPKLGSFDPASAPSQVDLTTQKWDNMADGYVNTILRLQHFYPDAVIVALLPTYTASYYSNDKLAQGNAILTAICQHYGVACVDLRECGISVSDLPDGIHPDAKGMDDITNAVLDVLSGCEMAAGENVVYSVTHSMINAKASCGYYKGISAGKPFIETLSGDNLSVTVTMGGKDISADCYANGSISIEKVTGNLVITAKAGFSLGAHLRQLPEKICAGTNLWAILEHDPQYYYVDKWDTHSSGKVYSVTIPVTGGDRIYATSIGASGSNGGSMDGIRVTFFDENGVLKAMLPAETYGAFSADGCLTAPEGATAVNIPMWNNSPDNELYILNRPHSYSGGKCTGCGEVAPGLAGKTLSVLGASISTFEGTSNGAAADTTNSTIRKNVKYYPNTTIPEVTLHDTWWMQVCEDLGLRLLVNNAWSGSAILLERSGTKGAYVDRCVQLHDNTGDNAGEEPDIICIQMGFNDFSYGKATLGTADIDYASLITSNGYGTPATTMEATAIMLDKITKRYPNAEIYMFNHFKRINQSAADTALMEALNADIETVCSRFSVKVVDLYSNLTDPAHIGDGKLHPNRLGMDVITEAVKTAILGEHPKETAYTVTLKLEDVTADYGTDKQVLEGDTYTVTLTSADELNVTVTMGGKDITAAAYAEGVVTIAAVTGDVIITAKAVHTPRDYRWEFNGTDLACTEGGNALTKTAGTTTGGVFSKTRYTLEKTVVLSHDQPWEVEWRSQGTWKNTSGSGGRMFTTTPVNADYNARYIFKSSANGLIAMGEKTTTGSHNYGIALGDHGIDANALHTYRLENRLNADGSNMIYLHVDGQEIGPMTGYYIGTNPQNTTSDWLSGKDFTFGYMGTDTHGFTNCEVEYIQVWEDGHTHSYEAKVTSPTCTEQGYTTHTCTVCGDSYVDSYVVAKGHTEVIDKALAATCTTTGKTEGKHCSACSTVIVAQKEVPAKGHTEVIDKAVSATCTTAGKTEGKHCSTCGTLVAQKEIPAKGHTWDAGKVTKEPTEKVEGIKTYTCTVCGETKTQSIPVLSHTHKYIAKVTAPTCTEQGYTTYTCTCGDSYVDNYVKATGHSYGAWTVTTTPTCTEKGQERRDCANCDAYETRDVVPKGHTEVTDEAVSATCTTAGKTEGKHCSACGTVLVKQNEIPALGHIWDVGVVTKEPTESEPGESVFTCQTCGETKTETLPPLTHVHQYTSEVTPPT